MTAEQIAENLVAARSKLRTPPPVRTGAGATLGAAALLAASALSLAAAVILGPGYEEKAGREGQPTIFGQR